MLVEVQVPAGISPGQALQIRAPSGQLLQVTVPAGVYAGMKFKAQVPAAAPAPAPAPAPVSVPRAGPGAYNQFQYPGNQMMRGYSMMGAGMPQPRIAPAPMPAAPQIPIQPARQQTMMVTVPAVSARANAPAPNTCRATCAGSGATGLLPWVTVPDLECDHFEHEHIW